MTVICYDTEFLEHGRTIDLISIGMVSENGDELYLISNEIDLHRLARHEWLMANVVPYLPLKRIKQEYRDEYELKYFHDDLFWDGDHPDFVRVVDRAMLRRKVIQFILRCHRPELWAWYGAYDHVALMQLVGTMTGKPDGVPGWTNDLRQILHELGDRLSPPDQVSRRHHALADAQWVMNSLGWVNQAVRQLASDSIAEFGP